MFSLMCVLLSFPRPSTTTPPSIQPPAQPTAIGLNTASPCHHPPQLPLPPRSNQTASSRFPKTRKIKIKTNNAPIASHQPPPRTSADIGANNDTPLPRVKLTSICWRHQNNNGKDGRIGYNPPNRNRCSRTVTSALVDQHLQHLKALCHRRRQSCRPGTHHGSRPTATSSPTSSSSSRSHNRNKSRNHSLVHAPPSAPPSPKQHIIVAVVRGGVLTK